MALDELVKGRVAFTAATFLGEGKRARGILELVKNFYRFIGDYGTIKNFIDQHHGTGFIEVGQTLVNGLERDLSLGYNLGSSIRDGSWDITRGMEPDLVELVNKDQTRDESTIVLSLPADLYRIASTTPLSAHNKKNEYRTMTIGGYFELLLRIPHTPKITAETLEPSIKKIVGNSQGDAFEGLDVNSNSVGFSYSRKSREFRQMLPTIVYNANKVYMHLWKNNLLSYN